MKKVLLTILKVLVIIIFVIGILIYSGYKAFKPTVDYIAKLEELAEEFNKPVETYAITTTVTAQNRKNIIEKFRNQNKDVFTDNKLDYKKMLTLTKSEDTTLNLTFGEYAFLKNCIKNNDNFLAYTNSDTIIKNSIFMGTAKDRYGEKILVKIDISEIIKKSGLSEIIENNFYLTVTKNSAGLYTYRVNQLDDEKSDSVMQVFDEFFTKVPTFKDYTVQSLGRKLFEEYNGLVTEFEDFVNISIILEQ